MSTPARSVHRILFVALAALALAFVACGSDADADPAVPSATTDGDPTATPSTDGGSRVAADGDNVQVHYHGTLDDGEVFDSSRERDPLSFQVGSGGVIQGFDDAVRGMAVGETVTVRIPPAEAYGELDESLIVEVPIDRAPEGLEVGDRVSAGGIPATVTAITDDTVTIDSNHELAGKALTFEIELVAIQ